MAGVEPGGGVTGRGPLDLVWRSLRRDPAAIFSLVLIGLLIAFAFAAPLLAHLTGHSGEIPNVDTGTDAQGHALPPFTNGYLFGTDDLGRDVLVRAAYGARLSILVGLIATALATVTGVGVGLFSGYFGGWIDTVMARFMDVVLSFPYFLVALALVAVEGPSVPVAVLIIAFFSWAAIGRVVRGQTLSQREKEYVEAARSMGAGPFRIMFVDILPNVAAPVIVLASLLIPTAIIFESALSFVGLGVAPPAASWGNMLAEWQSIVGFPGWWFWAVPSTLLLLATLAFNLLGDSIRDALDPRTERMLVSLRK